MQLCMGGGSLEFETGETSTQNVTFSKQHNAPPSIVIAGDDDTWSELPKGYGSSRLYIALYLPSLGIANVSTNKPTQHYYLKDVFEVLEAVTPSSPYYDLSSYVTNASDSSPRISASGFTIGAWKTYGIQSGRTLKWIAIWL